MIESLYFPLIFLAAVVGLGTAGVALRYRDRAGAKPLAVFAVAASLWALVEALSIAQSGIETMSLWRTTALTVGAVIPPAWLVFVRQYTGSKRFRSRKWYALLLVEPLLFWALLMTNTESVWTESGRIAYGGFETLAIDFGLAFWAHQAYSYLLLTAGAALLVRMLLRTNRLYRWQGTALLSAIVVPLLTNAAYSFHLLPPGIDPTAISYVLASVVLAITVFETELAGVAPATRELGREAALTELDDAILILNDNDRLVDANPAGELLLGAAVEDCLGMEISELSQPLARTLADSDANASTSAASRSMSPRSSHELEFEHDGRLRYYDVRTSALDSASGFVSGRVVSLRDITGRRQREQRLDVFNRLLRHNIRNELNLVRGKVELAAMEIDDEEASQHLTEATEAVDEIVARSNKLGRLSRMLDDEQHGAIDIAAEVRSERAVGGLAPSAGSVAVDLPRTLVVSGGGSLVAAFEELLSNGIEHNDGDDPRVRLFVDEGESDDSHVVIVVSDNGPGIEQQELETIQSGRETPLQHSSGVGLWLVTWVVERAGGTVTFENEDGCVVRVRLPRGE